MKWAVTRGYCDDNPAGEAISAALPKNGVRVRHQWALRYGEIAAVQEQAQASDALPSTKLASEMLILTACRSGEVRLALWA